MEKNYSFLLMNNRWFRLKKYLYIPPKHILYLDALPDEIQ